MSNILHTFSKRNKIISAFLRWRNPGISYCEKCGLPWTHCKNKVVWTSKGGGTFATCDVCWNNSSLDELKKYFTEVYKKQVKSSNGYPIHYEWQHLLECVETEYNHTHQKNR